METDAASNAAQPKSRRRWYQYSLRTLLIFVTLAGCVFGWLGIKVREAQQQQAAVAAIEKLGGEVEYDYEFDSQGDFIYPQAEAPGPKWLHALLGDDFFSNVCLADFATKIPLSITDADLKLLQSLTRLKQLELSHTKVTDAGLESLQGLTQLEWMFLGDTRVTDVGLEHLKGLTHLKNLYLENTRVTDAGVKKLHQALPYCNIHR